MSLDMKEIKSLLRRFSKCKDNLAFLLFSFAPWIGLAAGVAFILGKLAEMLSVPSSVIKIVLKLILCVLPLFPTLRIWEGRADFGGSSGITDGIMDCCFTIWLIVIIFVLNFK